MSLIERYDKLKAKNIVASVDIKESSKIAKDTWNSPYDIIHICSALSVGDNKIACQFIETNKSMIKVMYSPLVIIAPKCTVELFKQGLLLISKQAIGGITAIVH